MRPPSRCFGLGRGKGWNPFPLSAPLYGMKPFLRVDDLVDFGVAANRPFCFIASPPRSRFIVYAMFADNRVHTLARVPKDWKTARAVLSAVN